jgi:hypothetical protein
VCAEESGEKEIGEDTEIAIVSFFFVCPSPRTPFPSVTMSDDAPPEATGLASGVAAGIKRLSLKLRRASG